MSHLVTDEYWIAQVYRPYFGKKASSDPITNVLDRVLQFDMDSGNATTSGTWTAFLKPSKALMLA